MNEDTAAEIYEDILDDDDDDDDDADFTRTIAIVLQLVKGDEVCRNNYRMTTKV